MHEKQLAGVIWLPVAAAVSPVHAADYLSAAEAADLMFPEAQVQTLQMIALSKAERDAIRERSGLRQRNDMQQVWRAERDGELLGWTLIDDVIGKHEYITYAVGVTPDGRVVGIEILSYRETHGYEVRDPDWRRHFVGKTLDDPFRLDRDIPNIGGATLSCRNVTDGVKRMLVLADLLLAK